MKFLKYIIPSACAAIISLTACEDMMKTDSASYLFEENNRLDQASDSLYSAIGILSQMQRIGERYVLFGEVRGDLVSVPETAPFSLQEIANFNVTPDNQLISRRDFYSIINNCNYAISRMDTDITIYSTKVMMPEYAAIRVMRAWTYFQMGLAFGEVKLYTDPILEVDDSIENIPSVDLSQLVDLLIKDIEPYVAINMPVYGSIDGLDSRQFFIQPQLFLADLYLFKNNYETAAALYYDYINRNNLTMGIGYANLWQQPTRDNVNTGNMQAYNNDVVSRIPYASDAKLIHPDLVNLTYNTQPAMVPATWFVDMMNSRTHYYNQYIDASTQVQATFEGDIRGCAVLSNNKGQVASAFGVFETSHTTSQVLISKFYNNAAENSSVVNPGNPMMHGNAIPRIVRSLTTYRVATAYLRYAEAVNRAGKPSLAFAVLKNGLKQSVVNDSLIVNPDELTDQVVWTDFNNQKFDANWGSGMRGRGYGLYSTKSDYLIPELPTRNDSIQWVENEILNEMAAETCFEGNRFFDLLRIGNHNDNPADFVAERISRRFPNPAAVRSRLSNPSALWIK